MIWGIINDFLLILLGGSEYADFLSDIFAAFFTLLFAYILIVLPLQFIIRYLISFFSALSGTLPYRTSKMKKKSSRYNIFLDK